MNREDPGSCASADADAFAFRLLIDPFAEEGETPAPVAVTDKSAKTEAQPKPRSQAQLDGPFAIVDDWKRDHLGGVLTARVESRMRKVVSEVLAAGYTPEQVRFGLQRLAVNGKAETPAALSGACAEVKTNPALAAFSGTPAQWQNTQPVASTAPARRTGASGSTTTMRRPGGCQTGGTAA